MFDAPNSDLSILIVDDEEGVRSILSDYFSNLGYQASTAGSEADALAASAIPKIGFDRVIWGSDFPHIRSIGLDTQSRVGQMFATFDPEDQAKLVSGNAITAYNLPG